MKCRGCDLNARTTKDRILSPAPLAKLGYPCLPSLMTGFWIKPSFPKEDHRASRRDARKSRVASKAASRLFGYDLILPLTDMTSSWSVSASSPR